jgi:hypothetical protein
MQIFSRTLNRLPLIVGAASAIGLVAVTALIWYYFSPWFTQVGYSPWGSSGSIAVTAT